MVGMLKNKIESQLEKEGHSLTKAWYSKTEVATEDGRHEGVKCSEHFVLFMTKEVLRKDQCQKEVCWTLEHNMIIESGR